MENGQTVSGVGPGKTGGGDCPSDQRTLLGLDDGRDRKVDPVYPSSETGGRLLTPNQTA
jgi:hypothetical protein